MGNSQTLRGRVEREDAYANLTQAETARQKMTQPHDWRVTGRRPYFVTLIGESNE